jgi:ABC-type oligopeptide transport system substrate-binding subunit
MIELRYQDEEQWVKALQSGNYDLYLMGYKADLDALLSTTEATTTDDSATFLTALFQSQGDANFSRYNNPQVDKLLVQLAGVNPALKEERDKKLRQINRQLVKDLPIIGLFYIERL